MGYSLQKSVSISFQTLSSWERSLPVLVGRGGGRFFWWDGGLLRFLFRVGGADERFGFGFWPGITWVWLINTGSAPGNRSFFARLNQSGQCRFWGSADFGYVAVFSRVKLEIADLGARADTGIAKIKDAALLDLFFDSFRAETELVGSIADKPATYKATQWNTAIILKQHRHHKYQQNGEEHTGEVEG